MYPDDLRYTETHEWARLADSGIVTVGITRYAVEQLGDIVYLELPERGAAVNAQTPFGTIESVKAAVDLYAPVSGEVVEANSAAARALDTISADPYGRGWLVRIRPAGRADFDALMDAAAYEKHVAEAR